MVKGAGEKMIETTETLDEKIERLESEIKIENQDIESIDEKIVKMETRLGELEVESRKNKEEIEKEQENLKNIDKRIREIEERLRILELEEELKGPAKETLPEEEKPAEVVGVTQPVEEKIIKPAKKEKIIEKNLNFPPAKKESFLRKKIREIFKKEKTERIIEKELPFPSKEDIVENPKEKEIEWVMVDSLLLEEKEIVKAEMEKSTPEPFEPKKIKRDMGLFLKNQIVKSVSGFKVSEKMSRLASELRRKTLLNITILGLFAGASTKDSRSIYVIPERNLDNSKNVVSIISQEEMEKKTLKKYLEAFHISSPEELEQIREDMVITEGDTTKLKEALSVIDTSLYNRLTPAGRRDYLYSITNINSAYLLLDKPTCTTYVIGLDKKEVGHCTTLLGTTMGEEPNVITDLDGNRYTQTTTTPAGKYKVGHEGICKEDLITYDGRILNIYGSGSVCIHIVYPGEYPERMKRLKSPTLIDNRISYGCINVTKEFWDKCIAPYIDEGSIIMITPDFYKTTTYTTIDPNTRVLEPITKLNYSYSAKAE